MKLLTTIERNLSKVKPPFFDGLPVWDILSFFVRGIYQGAITSRAGSVSFSFFLALFPGIIFIFTLIAYLPLDVFQEELFGVLKDVLPASTHEMAIDAIEDVLTMIVVFYVTYTGVFVSREDFMRVVTHFLCFVCQACVVLELASAVHY